MKEMRRVSKNFIAGLSNPNLIRIFLFLFLLVSIPLTVIGVKTAQDLRSKAADTSVDFSCVDSTTVSTTITWSAAPNALFYIIFIHNVNLIKGDPRYRYIEVEHIYDTSYTVSLPTSLHYLWQVAYTPDNINAYNWASGSFDTPACTGPICGNGTCESGEDYNSCPADCPAPPNCNECSPAGYTQCVNNTGYQTCSQVGSCLKWVTTSCSSGQTCSRGTCSAPPAPKPTVSISANPSSITSGQSSTLSWFCTPNDGTVAVSISASTPPNIGAVSCTGSRTVTPSSSITYTAIANGPGGTSDSKSTSITVNGQPPPPPPPPPTPPKPPKPPGPGPSAGTLDSLQLEVSVPYLAGSLKTKAEIGSVSKDIEISGKNKSYTWDLKGSNLSLNKEYTLVITSDKTLVRKVKFTPTTSPTSLNVGDLILGDINQDNTIDSIDQISLIDSIARQTSIGDLNADKVTNSMDWAILLTNFGKKGD